MNLILFQARCGIRIILRAVLLPLFPLFSYAQSFVGSSGTPIDNIAAVQPGPTATITPPIGMQAGDLVVVYAHYRAAGASLTISATGGQSWINETTANGGNQTFAIFWCRYNGTWSGDPTISVGGTLALTAVMYVYRPSINTNSWAIHVPASNSSNSAATVTISGLTTTVPNTVTIAFWGSENDNTWSVAPTGAGWNKAGVITQYRNTTGNDQSHTAAHNIQTTAGVVVNVSQTQSISTATRTSIISWMEIAPPANDLCENATSLSSSNGCTSTAGTLTGATYNAITSIGCGVAERNDVWYRFVAQSTSPTITLSSSPANARIQIFSGTCTAPSSISCGNSSLTASGLTIGDTYLVRVYADPNVNGTTQTFNICVTDPPSNDNCAGFINLQVNSTCAKTMGTLVGATNSGLTIPAPCSGTVGPDVWYRFVATSASTTITIGDFGTSFGATRRIQLFTGTCAGLTSVNCAQGTGGSVSMANTTLTPGTTYYVRVLSNSTTTPTVNADFSICLLAPPPTQRFGNSYVNITKKTTGGVIEPGDILEIRMTINHTSGTLYNMRYLDNVPTNTQMLTGGTDRIQVITNEGIAVQSYTTAAGDDAATYLATPPPGQYQIRMNLGFGNTTTPSPAIGVPADNSETESASATGQAVASTNIPKGGGGLLFATSFRVVVTGNVGDVITLNAGKFVYRTSTSGPDITLNATPYQLLISSPMSLCANSTGVNMSQEFGGTFGTGTTLNRSTDLAFPIPGYAFANMSAIQGLGDGQYAIVKNLSPRSGTNRDADRSPVNSSASFPAQTSTTYRMHNGHWDIDGDHTGTSDAIGNIPQADGVSGGYMLMVNADYVASETYRQTLTNLCPNTYYEFSAWFRNICPTCGVDYTTGSNYTPRQPGVLPNLTFALDGLDRYNTGEISYLNVNSNSGGWVKKGFVFITGPSQTTATFSIRNNSQGGGGNDWAMDDITVATCLPSMSYSPTLNPQVCQANPIIINDTVRSYFSNYTHYKWQRSTNGGSSWTDVPGQTGSATPTQVGGQWEYLTSYQIPHTNTTMANNGDMYRLIVATTAANLNGSTCQVTDGVSQISLTVNTCNPVLGTNFISFNAKIENGQSMLKWTTNAESEGLKFIIERSIDGTRFTEVGLMESHKVFTNSLNNYSWSEPYEAGKYYYRVKMIGNHNGQKYSRVTSLYAAAKGVQLASIVNPFNNELIVDVNASSTGALTLQLVNSNGSIIRSQFFMVQDGLNRLRLNNLQQLSSGLYTLKLITPEGTNIKKLIKQ